VSANSPVLSAAKPNRRSLFQDLDCKRSARKFLCISCLEHTWIEHIGSNAQELNRAQILLSTVDPPALSAEIHSIVVSLMAVKGSNRCPIGQQE